MADFITLTALAIVAVSPLLRRIYIQRFWIAGRGTVIRLEGGINTNPGPGGGTWVWSPVIEYHAAGQRFSSRFSYWQPFNAKSKYAVAISLKFSTAREIHRASSSIAGIVGSHTLSLQSSLAP
jgi:hypothetical protein